jgi:UrcA family protein
MTKTCLLHKTAPTTLILALLLCPLASLAQSLQPTKGLDGLPAVSVNYGDLDLNRSEGRELLFKRLKNAARTSCAQFDTRALSQQRMFDQCVDKAIAGAILQIKAPAMAALYTQKTGNKLALAPLLTAQR